MNLENIEIMERVGDGEELLLTFDNGRKQIARVSQLSVMVSGNARSQRGYEVARAMKKAAIACNCHNVSEWLESQADKGRQLLDALP